MSTSRRFPLQRCPVCSYRVSCFGMCAHGCRVGLGPHPKKKQLSRKCLILLCMIAVVAGIFCGLALAPQSLEETIPQIIANESVSGVLSHGETVRMNLTLIPINVTASAAVYAGAKEAESPCYGSFDTYYPAIITDPMQDEFYADLLQQFRAIKEEYHLDDDQYLELMAAYVQTIPYDYNASVSVKYPVVTAVGGIGDCDDTSLLLAGLLAREGYDVVLLLYLDEGHMAVGVRTDEQYAFPNTGGYAYIETTAGMLIVCGDFPVEMLSGMSEPVVIKIGNGTRMYAKGPENAALYQYVYDTYSIIDPGEIQEPIVLNAPDDSVPPEDISIVSVNAFDRGYLYRMLIEKPV